MIAGYAPDWPTAHPVEAARHGAQADAAGLAIARAWVGLVEAGRSSAIVKPQSPARLAALSTGGERQS